MNAIRARTVMFTPACVRRRKAIALLPRATFGAVVVATCDTRRGVLSHLRHPASRALDVDARLPRA